MVESFELKFVNNCRAILETMKEACTGIANPPIDVGVFFMIDVGLSNMDAEGMIRYYANETHKYWDKVKIHDESFICNNVDLILNSVKIDDNFRKLILSLINNDKMQSVINIMKKNDEIMKKNGYSDDDLSLNYIWRAMEALVKLSIKYTTYRRTINPSDIPGATYELASMTAKWL